MLIILYVVAVFDSGKVFEYYYYLLKLCKISKVFGYLCIFCRNHEFIEDLFGRYSIKLLVTLGSIKVTNICMYQKLPLFC